MESSQTNTDIGTSSHVAILHIVKHNWKKVIKLLKTKEGPTILKRQNASGLTMLAFSIVHNPPTEVVQLMLSINPELSRVADVYGHLPIHIACSTGCTSSLVKLLIDHDAGTTAALPTESQMRYPLHYTCLYILNPQWFTSNIRGSNLKSGEDSTINQSSTTQSGFNEVEPTSSMKENYSTSKQSHSRMNSSIQSSLSDATTLTLKYEEFEDQLKVLKDLLSVAPHVVNNMDMYGYTAIDYLQDYLAENTHCPRWERCDIVSEILRSASITLYRRIKQESEEKGWDFGNYTSDNKSISSLIEGGGEESVWGALSQLEIDNTSFNQMDVNSMSGSLLNLEKHQMNLVKITEDSDDDLDRVQQD